MFGMAGETQFDLRFNLFGIPIRIHPIFWLSAAMLRWEPDRLDLVILAVICVFVSVLVHELGHALVLRRYGYPSEIVLYFLGGYATATRLPTWRQIWSLAAGPLAGLTLAAVVFIAKTILWQMSPGIFRRYEALEEVYFMLMFSGVIVNVLNLIPVLPLDGGQIMAALVSDFGPRGRESILLTLRISIACAAAVALWCWWCMNNESLVLPPALFAFLPPNVAEEFVRLQPDPKFLMFYFLILGAQSISQHNEYRSSR